MVKELNEVDQIDAIIATKKNFLLSGGAGSGKTYSLVQVIKRIFQTSSQSKVRCITFTNVAVDEIKSRVTDENLEVSTIHDFIWDCIKSYQKNIKKVLIDLINSNSIKHSFNELLEYDFFKEKTIEYKEWTKLADGIVSHDEVLILAKHLFKNYPLLGKITTDRFDFILIDEYQDTAPEVIFILLDALPSAPNSDCIIGFFGDSMQAIYDGSIGSIQSYVDLGKVEEVIKKDNRRNPFKVVELANRLRTDNIQQKQADDPSAPNYKVEGNVKFFYSSSDNLDNLKKHEFFSEWNFADSLSTKELYLTHNLIASKAKFSALVEVYDKERIIEYKNLILKEIKEKDLKVDNELTFGEVMHELKVKPTKQQQDFFSAFPELLIEAQGYTFKDFSKIHLNKDQLLGTKKGGNEDERKKGTKRDALISHLFNLHDCLYFYEQGKYREFLKHSSLIVDSIRKKQELKLAIEKLKAYQSRTIEEVITFAHESGILPITEKLSKFIEEKTYVYNRLKTICYSQFVNLYNFVEGLTPFSTQHNIKGAEFDNVLVVLDNGKWNNYNFKNYFLNEGTPTVLDRTKKIFYVCCTRTKKDLALFYYDPSSMVIAKARELFGDENVVCV